MAFITRRSFGKTLLVASTALLLTSAGSVLSALQDAPITLVRSVKAGEKLVYKSVAKTKINFNELVITIPITQMFKEVKPDGSFVMEVSQGSAEYLYDGKKTTGAAPKPTLETRDKNWKLTDYKEEFVENAAVPTETNKLGAMLSIIILSDKPMKPGDFWETEYPSPLMKNKTVKLKTTFVGKDKLNDKEVLKFEQVCETQVDFAGNKMNHTHVALLDPATGIMQKANITIKNLPGANGPLNLSIEHNIVKDAPAEK